MRTRYPNEQSLLWGECSRWLSRYQSVVFWEEFSCYLSLLHIHIWAVSPFLASLEQKSTFCENLNAKYHLITYNILQITVHYTIKRNFYLFQNNKYHYLIVKWRNYQKEVPQTDQIFKKKICSRNVQSRSILVGTSFRGTVREALFRELGPWCFYQNFVIDVLIELSSW